MGRNTKNKSRTMRHASAVLVVILAAALLAVGLMAAFTSEGTVTDQARVSSSSRSVIYIWIASWS